MAIVHLLFRNAIEALPQSNKTAEVYRQIGDLYRQIGLAEEAEVQYLEAVRLATATGNREELAAAQVGLGEVNWSLNRRDEAVRLLKEAKTEYEELGDLQRVNEIEASLVKKNGFNRPNYAKSVLVMTETLARWASWLKADTFIDLEGWKPCQVRLPAKKKLKIA
jgi:tetratricopeptide (TPR) repeat protein